MRIFLPRIFFTSDFFGLRSLCPVSETIIHNKRDISEFDEFNHLKSVLKGDTYKKLEYIDVSEQDYQAAWKTLVEFYDNKRLIISRHLDALLSLKRIETEDIDKLRALSDQAVQHVKCLENLGIQHCSEMTVKII